MKTFQLSQQYFRMLGIELRESPTQKYPINTKNSICVLLYSPGIILCSFYFFYEADAFMAYTFSFVCLSAMIVTVTLYSYIVWAMPNLDFISNIEEIIQGRE